MPGYNIQIPNEKAATYKVVTFIISMINLVAITYLLIRFSGESKLLLAISLVPAAAAVVVSGYLWRNNKTVVVGPWVLLITCSVTWIIAGHILLGISLLAFSLLCGITSKPLVIRFAEEAITYPSIPAKRISWAEIDFVLLKDDVLSIELKNNQLLQFTLESHVAESIDPIAFNVFCLNAASKTRPAPHG